jgi:PadR family transcriptional regulator PadR
MRHKRTLFYSLRLFLWGNPRNTNMACLLHTQYHEVSQFVRYKMVSKTLVAASTKPIILSILISGEGYGYQIIQQVKEISGGTLEWSDNMLYPVLRRMEKGGLLVSRWKISEAGRLRRYYKITEQGRAELDLERRQWMNVHRALSKLWKPLSSLE